MTVETRVELLGVDAMRRMLNGLAPEIQRAIRPAVRSAGELVAGQTRINAGWSARIPRATKVRTSFGIRSAGAAVVIDSRIAPHARAYEGIGGRGTFRHPVYGNRENWVTQDCRPSLIPAARAKEREAALLVQEAVRRVLPN